MFPQAAKEVEEAGNEELVDFSKDLSGISESLL